MEPRLGTTPGPDVAVGRTREEAAAIFGSHFENPVLTTYDDFATGPDPIGTVGLVAGPGLPGVLGLLVERDEAQGPGQILLGLPVDLVGRGHLLVALSANPALAISAVQDTGRGTVITLAPASAVDPAVHQAFLDEIRDRRAPEAGVLAARPEATPAAGTGAGTPRPSGRRRLAVRAAAVALALAVLGAAVLVVIGQTLGADGVLITLALVIVVGQGVIALVGLYALRLARGTRSAQDHLEQVVRARTERILRLSKENARRDRDRDREVLQELQRLHREVTAVGRLASRSRIEAKERSLPG